MGNSRQKKHVGTTRRFLVKVEYEPCLTVFQTTEYFVIVIEETPAINNDMLTARNFPAYLKSVYGNMLVRRVSHLCSPIKEQLSQRRNIRIVSLYEVFKEAPMGILTPGGFTSYLFVTEGRQPLCTIDSDGEYVLPPTK